MNSQYSGHVKTIHGLAIAILIISVGAEGLAGYTFFVILPPALSQVNTAAWNLINYNPGAGNEFRSGAQDLNNAANNLRNTGRSLLCSSNCNILGVPIPYLSTFQDTRQSLESLADNVQSLGNKANNLAQDFDQTVQVIHSVGYGALGIKDGLYYGVMTMLGLGGVGILTGIGLLVISGALRVIEIPKR